MITITLNKIKAHEPGGDLWKNLLDHLGKTEADDEEFPLAEVLKSNGLSYALWCLSCLPEHDSKWRLLAVKYAREVQHLMKDERSINALDVAEKYAKGEATDEELETARDAARAAWDDAEAGWDAFAATAARNIAEATACHDAFTAVSTAWCAAMDAWSTSPASIAEARKKQLELFLEAIQ